MLVRRCPALTYCIEGVLPVALRARLVHLLEALRAPHVRHLIGYDDRQINRIVIRMAQYFLDRDMRVIFGHDWREDGVMWAVADFAAVVAARTAAEMGNGWRRDSESTMLPG